jgi:poly(3-hydroxybutyrate) depolymerase
LHCPDADCPLELIGNLGNATDALTGRSFFLDYPCDIKPGEKLTFILNLHGGGSIGNWQRHYFPVMDYKDEYRLIVATPSGVVRAWIPGNDDEHLENIVELVYDAFGEKNIGAFWLAGHSQGGQTSNRLLVEKAFIRERLTGWVSLSGGRLGSPRSQVRAAIPAGTPPPGGVPAPPQNAAAAGGQVPALGGVFPAENLPDYPFSHIYTSGEHELPATGLPGNSRWAQALGCRERRRAADIVDTTAGYVYDTREQPNPNPVWGTTPRPGTAVVHEYPGCRDGLIVADIIRMDKGHTEGLEPAVTEAIIRMMVASGK